MKLHLVSAFIALIFAVAFMPSCSQSELAVIQAGSGHRMKATDVVDSWNVGFCYADLLGTNKVIIAGAPMGAGPGDTITVVDKPIRYAPTGILYHRTVGFIKTGHYTKEQRDSIQSAYRLRPYAPQTYIQPNRRYCLSGYSMAYSYR